MEKQTKFCETDLYGPVKKFFEDNGYNVHGEVKNCDIVATMGDQQVIIELKMSFNLKLVYQGMERKKITDQVYLCIPRPKSAKTSSYKNMVSLVKSLGIGLLTIALDSPMQSVHVILMPQNMGNRFNKNKKNALTKEICGRNVNINCGGSGKKKINTAFREYSIKIACILEREGEVSAKLLKEKFGCHGNAHAILYRNYYGWFYRTRKGVYALTPKGIESLENGGFDDVVIFYRNYVETLPYERTNAYEI